MNNNSEVQRFVVAVEASIVVGGTTVQCRPKDAWSKSDREIVTRSSYTGMLPVEYCTRAYISRDRDLLLLQDIE